MDGFNNFIGKVQVAILDPLITLLALAAFVVFVWGVIEFIREADSSERREVGRRHMIWGLIGLVIIFGAQAIVGFLTATVGGFR